jgi:Ribonuclease G/E
LAVFKIRVRGIYATALTKLALDWGFKIVQATPKVAARLGIEPDYSPPDLTVKDHQSRSGVVLLGECPAVEEFLRRLREYAEPVVFTSPVGRHEVFVGRAVGGNVVEGPGGLLFDVPSRYVLEQGAVSVYTVLKPPLGPARGVAAPEIVVEGKYLELNTTGRVTYSRHIPPEERLRLRILAETKLRNYASLGLRFKSSARYAGEEDLTKEAEELYRDMLRISQGGPPGAVLRRGKCLAVALFDKYAKERLDATRSAAAPTAMGHHALRAQGLGRCVDLLDYAGVDVYEKAVEYLAEGAVEILHIKPWGDVVKMRGEVIRKTPELLVVRRALKPGGVLDGLGVKIEKGFYALTCIPRRGHYVVHSYYDAGRRHVGTYLNINTEPEWGRRVVYIDLLVDRVYNGEEKTLDLEEFSRYADAFPERLRDPLALAPGEKMYCTPQGVTSTPPQSASS